MTSRFVYLVGRRLSQAELSAARLDGDVVALGEAFVPADVVETPALRAASLGGLLGDTLAASHLSAAWVHGGLDDPPPRHTVQRAVSRRLHHVIDRRVRYRDPSVPGADLLRIGGVAVTTVARTVADLARTPDRAYTSVLERWADADASVVAPALRWLSERPQLPHGRRARQLLEGLMTT